MTSSLLFSIALEYDTLTPARAWTQTSLSGVKHTGHKTTKLHIPIHNIIIQHDMTPTHKKETQRIVN